MPKKAYVFLAIWLALGAPSAKTQRISFRAPSFRAPNMGARPPIRPLGPLGPAPIRRNRFTPGRPTRRGSPLVREAPQVGIWSGFNTHRFARPAPGTRISAPPGGALRSRGSNANPANATGWSRFGAHSLAKPGPGSRTFPGTNHSSGFGPNGRTFPGPSGSRFTSGTGLFSRRPNPWSGANVFVAFFPSPFFGNAFLFPFFPRFFVFNSFFFSPFFFARPFFFPSFLNPFFTSPFGFFDPFLFSGVFASSPIFFEPSFFNPFLPAFREHALLASRDPQALAEPPVSDFGGKAVPSEQPTPRQLTIASDSPEQPFEIDVNASGSLRSSLEPTQNQCSLMAQFLPCSKYRHA